MSTNEAVEKRDFSLSANEINYLIQALTIASNHCTKLFQQLVKVAQANGAQGRIEAQIDHASYWNDLAKEFTDLKKNIDAQAMKHKTSIRL